LALGIEQAWRHGHDYFLPEKFAVVEPGKIYRGAWQHDWPMQSIIRRYGIKTIVALAHRPGTAMPVREESLARQAGVRWLHVPITDDRSELEGESLFDRLDEAADALADPANQPVYFHCHHGINRASMVQIAFRLKHSGWSLEKATAEIAQNFGLREVDRGPDYRLMSQYFAQRIAPARAKTAASGPPPERHQHASLASP
jgi:protein tyrosine phosphatase (PTP) superfamily phosphohydrolase (DUF442 family)